MKYINIISVFCKRVTLRSAGGLTSLVSEVLLRLLKAFFHMLLMVAEDFLLSWSRFSMEPFCFGDRDSIYNGKINCKIQEREREREREQAKKNSDEYLSYLSIDKMFPITLFNRLSFINHTASNIDTCCSPFYTSFLAPVIILSLITLILIDAKIT